MDYTVHGIFQARILELVAYPFSSRSSWPRNELGSPALQADSLPTELSGKPFSNLKGIQKMTDCNTLGNHLRMYTTKREKIKKELEFRKQWIQHGRQAKGGHQVKGESSKMSIMQEV